MNNRTRKLLSLAKNSHEDHRTRKELRDKPIEGKAPLLQKKTLGNEQRKTTISHEKPNSLEFGIAAVYPLHKCAEKPSSITDNRDTCEFGFAEVVRTFIPTHEFDATEVRVPHTCSEDTSSITKPSSTADNQNEDDTSVDKNENDDPFEFDDEIVDPNYMPRSSEEGSSEYTISSINASTPTPKHSTKNLYSADEAETSITEASGVPNLNQRFSSSNTDITKEQIERSERKSYSDRKDYCLFCEKDVTKFARHISTWHSNEVEVQRCLAKPLKSKERRQSLCKLKKQWNFLRNRLSMTVRPVKSVQKSSNYERNDFLPCSYCLGFYSRHSLYRHTKRCPDNPKAGTVLQKRQTSQSDGQTTLVMGYYKKDRLLEKLLFPRLRANPISLAVKKDPLIREFAYSYLKGHRSKGHINALKYRCRQLAKLVKLVQNQLGSNIKGLFDVLKGYNIRLIINAVNVIGEYNEDTEKYNSPTVAINFGTWLKQACDIAVRVLMEQKGDTEAQRNDLILLKTLIASQWANEVSTQASQDLNKQKWNKVELIPLSSDVKKLNDYLTKGAEKTYQELKANTHSYSAYTNLKEILYCQIVLLNRRRPGEVAEITLTTYKSINLQHKVDNEFESILTETEKILLQTFHRFVIRGKRGRGVPILMSPKMKEHFDFMLECRSNFVKNNDFIFHTGGLYSIDGTKLIQKIRNDLFSRKSSEFNCNRFSEASGYHSSIVPLL